MKKLLVAFLSLALLLLLLPLPVHALGVAIAPAAMEFKDALRGNQYQRSLTVINPSPENTKYNLRADGVAAPWLSFFDLDSGEPVQQVLIPGQRSAYVRISLNIPPDIRNGNFAATIYAETAPSDIPGYGVSTVMQAKCEVAIGVTGTQIIEGTVGSIRANDTEAGLPLRLSVNFKNSGNVQAQPSIHCIINKETAIIDEFDYRNSVVQPQSQDDIQIEWPTGSNLAGNYNAQVTVSLDSKILAAQNLDFRILPAGTFTRHGELISLSYIGQPIIDTSLKIQAGFKNTGDGDAPVKLFTEVYLDSILIDTVSSEETLVPFNRTGTVISYVKLSKTGNYTIRGYLSYSGKQTETKEISFSVAGNGLPVEKTGKAEKVINLNYYPVIIGIAAVIVAAGIVFVIFRRSRKSPGNY
jgi:hypothetical protein